MPSMHFCFHKGHKPNLDSKDVRDGTIVMKDHEDQHLEVVRQIKTGLIMIRIDHRKPHRFMDQSDPNRAQIRIYLAYFATRSAREFII